MNTRDTIPVTFPTLRSAGYQRCEHPRVESDACMDCGATRWEGVWVGGHLEYARRPLRCGVPRA